MFFFVQCEGCGEQYPAEASDEEVSSSLNEMECACGEKCCQKCATLCDGCKTPICDHCSATHWYTGEDLCLKCAAPMYTEVAA